MINLQYISLVCIGRGTGHYCLWDSHTDSHKDLQKQISKCIGGAQLEFPSRIFQYIRKLLRKDSN